jgi:hypothetical protein
MLVGIVVLCLGGLILVFSSALADVTRGMRDRRIVSSSYLSAERVTERRETMGSPGNRSFDMARLRIFGGLLTVGGIIGIVRALGG